MKARYRCKQHSQGDHCRLELSHTADHLGQFTRWNGQQRIELAKRRAPHKDHAINRFLRHAAQAPERMTGEDRQRQMSLLQRSIAYLRGQR